MKVSLKGTRGSVGRSGPETMDYGGDTSCAQVVAEDGTALVLDAGSGIARLNSVFDPSPPRIDILLTHLHMDHIQGLGFFQPLFDPDVAVHLWGPVSSTMDLGERIARYLSPPLFPVRFRDLPNVHPTDVLPGSFDIGPFAISADLVIHPGPTLGYRITEAGRSLAYLPDHEPALGNRNFPGEPEWTSGFDLCEGADVLIHDFQYTDDEYPQRQGWGHSATSHALAFADLVGTDRLVTFHHDPEHDDHSLDALHRTVEETGRPFELIPGKAGLEIEV